MGKRRKEIGEEEEEGNEEDEEEEEKNTNMKKEGKWRKEEGKLNEWEDWDGEEK